MSIALSTLSAQVGELARQTGAFIREEYRRFDRRHVEYKGLNNLVSYVDKEAEKRLVAGLGALLPEAGFLAEEGSGEAKEGLNWVVDPLDGTTNFIHGVPVFAISIALVDGKDPLLGIVYAVCQDELFDAVKGGGTRLNGQPVRVSPANVIGQALLATGFPYEQFERMGTYLQALTHLMQHTHGLRRMGSAAIDLAYVACGRFEAFFEYNLNPWDVAAGALLVREAGGYATTFLGEEDCIFGREMIAANAALHTPVLSIVREHFYATNR